MWNFHYKSLNFENGYSAEDVMDLAETFELRKITDLSVEQVEALMEEMKEMNILRATSAGNYLFARYSFFRMIGTREEINQTIMEYMEG